jgi:hypothetical protein
MKHTLRAPAPPRTEAEIQAALKQFLRHGGAIKRLPDQVVLRADTVRLLPGTYTEVLDAPPIIYRRTEVPEAQAASA